MGTPTRSHHVALGGNDIDEALEFWRDGLGLKVASVEDVPDQRATVAFLSAGDQELELVKPTDEHSGTARYLQEHGPGMHHICMEVDDLAESLEHLRSMGVELINDEPVEGAGGKLIAFIHPRSTHGVLVELCESIA